MYHVNQDETAYWVLGKSDSNGTYEDVKTVFKSNSTQQNGPSLSSLCSRKGNVTRKQLVAEKGMQTEDGVACEVSGKR